MFFTSSFKIKRGNFTKSAQEAIQSFFNEKGYAPKEVFVHPDTQIGTISSIDVMLAGQTVTIPVSRRAVIPGVSATSAALAIEEPNNPAE